MEEYKMKTAKLFVAGLAMLGIMSAAKAGTLDDITARGELRVAVQTQGPPFSMVGIDHVVFIVDDLEKAVKWYADVLGCQPGYSYPTLGMEQVWGGYVDITRNRAPHWGRLTPNVYFAQGFSGHGVAATGLAGAIIAEAIAGQNERLDVFERIPHGRFPGGKLLRMPLLVAAMSWYKLRDVVG
jgi:catechol 2,3-dioxygenase-like lactoylglutathione lyase family enzyme